MAVSERPVEARQMHRTGQGGSCRLLLKGPCSSCWGRTPTNSFATFSIVSHRRVFQAIDWEYEGLVTCVVDMIEGSRRCLDLTFDVPGTSFQKRVWLELLEIAPRQTMSPKISPLASGSPKSVRPWRYRVIASSKMTVRISGCARGVERKGPCCNDRCLAFS